MNELKKIDFDATGSKQGGLVLSTSYTALAIVRSLGRNGIPVWILDNKRAPTASSRYVWRKFPFRGETEEEQVEYLVEIAKQYGLKNWALFPDSDKNAALIARNYSTLEKYYRLTTPPWDILQWSLNKNLTYKLASEAGINYPKTFYPKDRTEVASLDGQFPMILKPAHHEGHDPFSTGRAWEARNRDELLLVYDEMCGLADQSVVMIQEMIPAGAGTQLSYAALCKDGEVLADVFAERIRLTPPEFGVSAFVGSIEKLEIEAPAKRWLKKNCYTGICELEFMFDQRDGLYKLLDVNTRAWGWIAMCTYAGVDFPYLMWRLVQGDNIEKVRAQAGIHWVRTLYDLEAAIPGIRTGSISMRDYLSSLKGAKHEMYEADDLKPALVELWRFTKRALRKLKKLTFGKIRLT